MAIYFTSDTHFGDTRILKSARRPFATIAAHDAEIIARWQATVSEDDEIWHLGDVAPGYTAEALDALLEKLPGRKHLVTGNNDDAATRNHPGWASVQDYAELTFDGVLCILFHYPLRTWNKIGKGAIDLHGHSHAMLKPLTRQYDVGVDAFDFTPVTLETIRARRRRPLNRPGSRAARSPLP
ncbi:Metallophosphoesterase [Beijerinckiaceae bacterium RH AL1]|nr:metallophosphoesterase family protein [Beijerinckiaceae bacterium]VVB46784.1 Metallophosphoesterase [Beijerinckiaceae bacterium RH CH11]VVB46867.1 Metallophosphoesterase [Beijerinckiaceae bacterium RH AL8]VVC55557.1 Metallophosphoesterase [Beijerinckiaceae bacterium RH AL1]